LGGSSANDYALRCRQKRKSVVRYDKECSINMISGEFSGVVIVLILVLVLSKMGYII
jgi:hypothetical protein